MRRILFGGLVGAALAVTGAHADILIGGVGPLTGAYANIGEQMQRGAETAVADLNAAGGVLDQQLKIIFLDDACDASQAVAAAQKLVATKVPFVAVHYCSGASIPAAKVYEEAGIIQISPASTNPRLTEEGHALLIRGARESGYNLQLVGGDALSTDSFWQIAGKAGEGTLFTLFPDARNNAVAKPVVERFRKQGFEPDGYTLYAYADVQVWVQAAAKAGSVETKAVITALRTNEFDTVLGRISFDAKGDLTQPAFVWNVWHDGKSVQHEKLTRVK